MKLILASLSEARREMLAVAGVRVDARSALLSEDLRKAEMIGDGLAPHAIAKALAELKALSIPDAPGKLVIGCDQTLEFGDIGLLDKPKSRAEAVRQLKMLSGKSHFLHSAAAIVEDGKVVWRHIDSARLTMRSLSERFINAYLDLEFETVRNSVGCYHIEGRGVQLFDWIEGSYFTIRGLPLLPLLKYLREREVLPELMAVPYAEVIGDPIGHSKSPLVHNFWLKQSGLEGEYRQTQVAADELPSYLAGRRKDPNWRGCNVTMPLKVAIQSHLDDTDTHATRIGAVNTVVRRDSRLAGFNTDWQGLNLALGEVSASEKDVVLIGAGGAARAALEELRQAQPRTLTVMNRDVAKAARLLDEFGLPGEAKPIEAPPPVDLLINASPLGMKGYPSLDLDLAALRSGAIVLDMVYEPLETKLLQQARERDLIAIDGLKMLIWQGALAFQFFFNALPDPVESDALRELLSR